jgi:hypothetical protein
MSRERAPAKRTCVCRAAALRLLPLPKNRETRRAKLHNEAERRRRSMGAWEGAARLRAGCAIASDKECMVV